MPYSIKCPRFNKLRRSHNNVASFISCVVKNIVVPASFSSNNNSWIFLEVVGSNPLVGSSKNNTCGLLIKDLARNILCFIPVDNFSAAKFLLSYKSTCFNTSSTREFGFPYNFA